MIDLDRAARIGIALALAAIIYTIGFTHGGIHGSKVNPTLRATETDLQHCMETASTFADLSQLFASQSHRVMETVMGPEYEINAIAIRKARQP